MTTLIVQVRPVVINLDIATCNIQLTTYTSPENLNVSTHNFIGTFSSTVFMPSHTELALFPGRSCLQFLIACSIQKWRGKSHMRDVR